MNHKQKNLENDKKKCHFPINHSLVLIIHNK